MKVLLLGVTGNVGSRMLPALIKNGHTVVAYVRSESRVTPELRAVLADVAIGSATDVPALKNAILKNNCDAVFNAAGLAPMFGSSKNGEFAALFAAVVKAVVEARRERGGAPIRTWLMSGFTTMDSPTPQKLLVNYVPMYPEHTKNLSFIQAQDKDDIAWSLFCASQMSPKYEEARIPAPDDCSGDNLIASVDSPPDWQKTLKWVPLIGTFLNILVQAGDYSTTLEDPVHFIADDFKKGLQSELIGKRVAFKEKAKAS